MAEVFNVQSVKSGNTSANVSEKSELNNGGRLQLILRSEFPLGKLVKVCKAALHGWGKLLTWTLQQLLQSNL